MDSQWIRVRARGVIEGFAESIYCCGESSRAPYGAVAATRGLPPGERSAIMSASREAQYNFPAYAYMDSIGGASNQTLAFLIQ
jgi:hypothetical protein